MFKALTPAWIKPRLYHLLSPLVALALVAIVDNYTTILQLFENQTVNLRFRARAPFDPPADPRLIFVGIDEPTLAHLGRFPWPRNVEADFVKTIANSGVIPHTVAFDLMFTEESNKLDAVARQSAGDNDKILGDALGLLPSAITGAFSLPNPANKESFEDEQKRTEERLAQAGPTLPLPNIIGDIHHLVGSEVADLPVDPIRTQSLFGFVNDDPSLVDDIRHTVPLAFRLGEKVYPSLALQTLCQMLNVDPDKVVVDLVGQHVRLTNSSGKTWVIPTNDRAEFSINYRRQQNFRTASLFGLMQNLNDHAAGKPLASECDISNKTLLVGESATSLVDLGPTPLASRTPLPFVHLNVVNNVLKNDYLTFVPWWWVVIGWSLVTWPTLLRLKDAPLGEAITVPIALILAYIIAAFAIFWLWSIEIALFWPVTTYVALNFGGVVLRWREERRGREELKQLFSSMLSPEVLNHLLDHPENVKLGGSERAVTILFSDIRDYTKFSEGLSAGEVVRQLNIYFERMVACVKEQRGTFHKYIGDAIMAAWGDIAAASLGSEQDAQNAVRSALKMRRHLHELNEERKAINLIPLRIGIGLNHGAGVLVGLIGASSQMEFTVMGDAVNTASRLEGLTKEFKTDLAISESVKELIGNDFLVRRLGLIVLKGKSEATVVYEVLAEKSDLGASRMSPGGVERYETAFDDFLARRFAQAEAGFAACAKDYPDDHCAKTYLAASREFIVTPPPDDWDGRIVMTSK
jgi:adenylate cyclase